MMVIIARIKVVIVINILTHIAISHVSMELPICCGTLRCETKVKVPEKSQFPKISNQLLQIRSELLSCQPMWPKRLQ